MGQSRYGAFFEDVITTWFRTTPPALCKKRKTYVYFVSDLEKYIKIGVAKNVQGRMNELQVGNPKKLYLVEYISFEYQEQAYIAEKKLHSMFFRWRACGEWFELSCELCAFMKFITHYNDASYKTHWDEFYEKFSNMVERGT